MFFLRKRLVVFFFLVLVLLAFAYVKKEIFFQQAKRMIEQNLEKSFPCEFSIEKIRPGLLYGLVLENVEFKFSQVSGIALDIRVDEAHIDYSLWETIFSRQKRDIRELRLTSPAIRLSYPQSPYVTGPRNRRNRVTQESKFGPGEFVLVVENGQISFGKFPPLFKNLRGKILLTQEGVYVQDFEASIKDNFRGRLKIYGELSRERVNLSANLEHLKLGYFDILTNFALTLNKKLDIQENDTKLCGTLKTYGSVLNNRPFPELNSSFEIQARKLRLLSCSLGDSYDLRGIADLAPPFNADLCLNFYQAAPAELLSRFSWPEAANFSGLLNGLIKITGPIGSPKVGGYLEAKHGNLGDLNFVSANINIKGRYPKISIVDSRILREKDTFLLEGEIDLTNLERQDFVDIDIKPDKGIFWQGWDITRSRDNRVHMSKSVAEEVKITFDAFVDDEGGNYGDSYANELGLEYRILGDKLLKLRLKKDEEILGFERRINF